MHIHMEYLRGESQSCLRRTDEKSVWTWRLSVSSADNLSWKEFKTIAFLLEDVS